jgi:AraC-like DNA-binding protein
MMNARTTGVDNKLFLKLSRQYRRRWRVQLWLVRPDGSVIHAGPPGLAKSRNTRAACAIRKRAIESALRWGDPTVESYDDDRLMWGVPLMHNAGVVGGLIAQTTEQNVFPRQGGPAALDIRAACTDLRLMAERENLTNASFLSARRDEYLHEQERAQAIHEFKVSPHDDIRGMYLRKEPELLAAIRRHDRPAARQVLNGILVAMLHKAGESLELIKTFFLELVVMMCRSAVEAGGKPEELLGANFKSLQRLSHIQSEEQLAPWLRDILDHVMDSIGNLAGRSAMVPLVEALDYMEKHLGSDISRGDIARAAHLSPYHFSRLFRLHMGRSCGDMLSQIRADKAAELLTRTGLSLAEIAIDCGFRDQSYFTKVFRRYHGSTPRKYRIDHQAATRVVAESSFVSGASED